MNVEYSTAVSNWFKMCWRERWHFTSNTEHIFVDRRQLLPRIRCMNMTSRRHAPQRQHACFGAAKPSHPRSTVGSIRQQLSSIDWQRAGNRKLKTGYRQAQAKAQDKEKEQRRTGNKEQTKQSKEVIYIYTPLFSITIINNSIHILIVIVILI